MASDAARQLSEIAQLRRRARQDFAKREWGIENFNVKNLTREQAAVLNDRGLLPRGFARKVAKGAVQLGDATVRREGPGYAISGAKPQATVPGRPVSTGQASALADAIQSRVAPTRRSEILGQVASGYPSPDHPSARAEQEAIGSMLDRRGEEGLAQYGATPRATRRTARLAAGLAPAGATPAGMATMDYSNPDHLRRAALAGGLVVGDKERLATDEAYRTARRNRLGFFDEALQNPEIRAQAEGLGLVPGNVLSAAIQKTRRRKAPPRDTFGSR